MLTSRASTNFVGLRIAIVSILSSMLSHTCFRKRTSLWRSNHCHFVLGSCLTRALQSPKCLCVRQQLTLQSKINGWHVIRHQLGLFSSTQPPTTDNSGIYLETSLTWPCVQIANWKLCLVRSNWQLQRCGWLMDVEGERGAKHARTGLNYCRIPPLAVFVSATNPGSIHGDTRRLRSLQSSGPLVASIIDGSEYGTGGDCIVLSRKRACRTSIGHAWCSAKIPRPQPLPETESGASGGVIFLHPASLAQPLVRWRFSASVKGVHTEEVQPINLSGGLAHVEG